MWVEGEGGRRLRCQKCSLLPRVGKKEGEKKGVCLPASMLALCVRQIDSQWACLSERKEEGHCLNVVLYTQQVQRGSHPDRETGLENTFSVDTKF